MDHLLWSLVLLACLLLTLAIAYSLRTIGIVKRHLTAQVLVWTAVTLLILSIAWWPSAPTPPTLAEISTPKSTVHASIPREIGPLSSPSDPKGQSRAEPLTPHEKERIENKIAQAKDVIQRIELRKATAPAVTEGQAFQSTTVRVPALTVDDLQPLYDALSRAAEEFAAGSPERDAFRRRADGLLTAIRKRPSKVILRSVERAQGGVTYKVITLSEEARVTILENGGVSVDGKNAIKLVEPGEENRVAEFFDRTPAAPLPIPTAR